MANLSDLASSILIGIIIGGRLGYVIIMILHTTYQIQLILLQFGKAECHFMAEQSAH